MIIHYPDTIKWSIDISSQDINQIVLSNSFKSDVKNTLKLLELNNYLITVEMVTESFLDEFEPFYKEMILSKERPEIINIRKHIKFKKTKRIYSAFVLRKEGVFIGALIFREFDNMISCAFKTFPHSLEFDYRSNLASVIDFYGIQYAIDNNISHYVLGKDRNLYGKFAQVGLARYKLALGALPYASTNSTLIEYNTISSCETESLIFYSTNKTSNSLEQGLIFTVYNPTDINNKYGMLFKQTKIEFNTQNRTSD
jgi:hypothetical protein